MVAGFPVCGGILQKFCKVFAKKLHFFCTPVGVLQNPPRRALLIHIVSTMKIYSGFKKIDQKAWSVRKLSHFENRSMKNLDPKISKNRKIRNFFLGKSKNRKKSDCNWKFRKSKKRKNQILELEIFIDRFSKWLNFLPDQAFLVD